uniref:AAA family ATPase n=1 Tax=Candidatus Cryptobacteroides bacterium TaxID=3085639 RepID=UPI0040252D5E
MRIIGIKVKDGSSSVIKNLKPGGWYPFGDYEEPIGDNCCSWRNDEYDNLLSEIYKSSSDEALPKNLRISVSSIVGQNGSGKTTLLELMFRIINNFSCILLDKKQTAQEKAMSQSGRELSEANGFSASLYFETDGYLGSIDYSYGNITYHYKSKNDYSRIDNENFDEKTLSVSKRKKLLAGFFYTICTNYSIHSFCQEDYSSITLFKPEGEDGVDGKWVRGLLHKNDGYLAPMVVVPYRDEHGNIDIKNEKDLAEQRLATLSILFWSQGKYFVDKYRPAYLEYRFDEKSLAWYSQKLSWLCEERLPLNRKLHNGIYEGFSKAWSKRLDREVKSWRQQDKEVQSTLVTYLAYKTTKICFNYTSFGVLFGLRPLTREEVKSVKKNREKKIRREFKDEDSRFMRVLKPTRGCYVKVVDAILSEQEHTHITLKIRQVLEFLKRGVIKAVIAPVDSDTYLESVVKISADTFIEENLSITNKNKTVSEGRQKKRFETYDEVYEILPPAFFQWKLYLLPKGEKLDKTMDNGILMSKMSSGEKQILQSASYLLYHIKNIESIREDSNRKAYHHVNLVLDEAELYYHPEMQRTMIANVIKMLSWCHINNTKIRTVNIIVVTHSPFVLSDVPKSRILYLKEGNVETKDNQTFAANVHDLLYNQFFIQNPIGEAAYSSVKQIIEIYNKENLTFKEENSFTERLDYYRHVVTLIGENYLRKSLDDMLEAIMTRIKNKNVLKQEYERLKQRLSEIKEELGEETYEED